jgi:multidrug resistance efflux pump
MPKSYDPEKYRTDLLKQQEDAKAAVGKLEEKVAARKAVVKTKQESLDKAQATLAAAKAEQDGHARAVARIGSLLDHIDNLDTEPGAVAAASFAGQTVDPA